jgi:serine/threonine-protein kinase
MSGTFSGGQTLGRYRIVRLLGSGAMGDVYLAEDPQIERQLAIKTVRVADGRTAEVEDRKRRLLREAKAAGRLIHPNVVTLFDAGEADGVLYLAFEFVDGADLAHRLEEPPPLTVGEALRIVRETAEALEAAHQQGIVHRDIKPSNILLDKRGRVKVADFGIARMAGQTSELTMTGSVVGSPHYLSPEQVRGDELDGRTDVFSLGVVLYELLGQRRPFDGETLTTLVYQILHREAPPIPGLRPDLSPRLEDLLKRMLHKDREQRFPTAAALAEGIGRLERELPQAMLGAPAREDTEATQLLGGAPRLTPPPAPASSPRTVSTGDQPTTVLASSATQAGTAPAQAGTVVPPPSLVQPSAAASQSSRGALLVLVSVGVLALLAGGGFLGWRLFKSLGLGQKAANAPATAPAESGRESGAPASARTAGGSQSAPSEPAGGGQSSPSSGAAGGGRVASATEPVGKGTRPGASAAPAAQAPPKSPLPRAEPGPGGASPAPAGREPARAAVEPRRVPATAAGEPAAQRDEPAARPAVPTPLTIRHDREMSSGISLTFDVQPPDTFLRLRELSEERSTPIGQAQDYSGKGREGRPYRLPGEGDYALVLRKEGLPDYTILLHASAAAPATRIKVQLGASRAADGTVAVSAALRVRKGVQLRGEPDSARVSVDGNYRGLAREFSGRKALELEPGLHRILVEVTGKARQEFEVQVAPNAPKDRETLRFDLGKG